MANENSIYDTLNMLARSGKMPHAMIIEDTDVERALGKILFSVKVVLCDSESEKPCGNCGNCVKIDSGSHTDVTILKPEKENASIKVDEIRKIREDTSILSFGGKQKFYIVENADLMTVQAQNAFIKILEEPPKNVVFILVCKTATSLLPTVRSRCQMYSSVLSNNDQAAGEIAEAGKSIVNSCLGGDVIGMMKAVEDSGNDRKYLKMLLESITEEIIKRFANGDCGSVKSVVEELWELLKISNNNININLFKGRIMAALIELGGKS